MPRTLQHEGALIVELPAHPCARSEDLDRVTYLVESSGLKPSEAKYEPAEPADGH